MACKKAQGLNLNRAYGFLIFLLALSTFTPLAYAQETSAEPLFPAIIAIAAIIASIFAIVKIKRNNTVKLSIRDPNFMYVLSKDYGTRTLGSEPELVSRVENNIPDVSLPSQHHHEPIKAQAPT